VDRLAQHYRKQELSVGIIAVDPTSPFSGGAILGDRIRMQSHAADKGVFIRSMATRGFLGGLARATADVAMLLDAAGKQIILIETVGVGQDEVDIVRLADCSIVVLMPGQGDEVQAIKAGIMEIADVFAINKADREGAARFEEQLLAMLHLAPLRDGWSPPVQRTVATEDKGTAELIEKISAYRQHMETSGRRRAKRVGLWKQRLLDLLESRMMERIVKSLAGERELDSLAIQVSERKKDPYTAVDEILAHAGFR
jgi:LAO/AO transport system kinase